jgi:hypothetical protein
MRVSVLIDKARQTDSVVTATFAAVDYRGLELNLDHLIFASPLLSKYTKNAAFTC